MSTDKETIGSPLSSYVSTQIKVREDLHRISGGSLDFTQKVSDRSAAIHSNSAWVMLRSGVNVRSEYAVPFSPVKDPPISLLVDALTEAQLGSEETAKQFILSGGLVSPSGGFLPSYSTFESIGERPRPGITSIKVSSKNTFGTLYEAEVNFTVWSVEDLEKCETLFFRPGYTALLEWGHSMYVDNQGNLKKDPTYISNDLWFKSTDGEILEKEIETLRETSSGNYEGIFGFIINYSWNFRVDGGYDCTVRIVSKGIVLESLKIPQTSIGKPSSDSEAETYEEAIETQKSIFHKVLGILEKQEKASTTGGQALIFQELKKDSSIKNIEKLILGDFPIIPKIVTIDGQSRSTIAYIPLRTFLELYNFTVLLKAGNSVDTSKPIVSFDAVSTAKYLTFREHYSLDPTIAVPPHYISEGEYEYSNFNLKGLHSFMYNYANENGGRASIRNIMIASPVVYEIIDQALEATEEQEVGAYQIIRNLLDKIQYAFGNVNSFDIWLNETTGKYHVIDRKFILNDQANFIPELTTSGLGSAFLEIRAESKIASQIASQVAIAAQGGIGDLQENISELLKWNLGVVDRHYPSKRTSLLNASDFDQSKVDHRTTIKTLWNNFNGIRTTVKLYNESQYSDERVKEMKAQAATRGSNSSDVPATFVTENWRAIYTSGCSDLNRLLIVRQNGKDSRLNIPAPLPIEVYVKLLGINGVKVGSIFRFKAGKTERDTPTNIGMIFPPRYRSYGFLITGVEHTIENNKWITNIKTQYYPLPSANLEANLFAGVVDSSPVVDTKESPTPVESLSRPNAALLKESLKPYRNIIIDLNKIAKDKDFERDFISLVAIPLLKYLVTKYPVYTFGISSGTRTSSENNSNHVKGRALDLNVYSGKKEEISTAIQDFIKTHPTINIGFIDEYSVDVQKYLGEGNGRNCFHISLPESGKVERIWIGVGSMNPKFTAFYNERQKSNKKK